MTEAYAYLRLSGLGQVEKDGFVRQLAAIENYGLANQVRIVRVFRKKGVADSVETMNRPEVKKNDDCPTRRQRACHRDRKAGQGVS